MSSPLPGGARTGRLDRRIVPRSRGSMNVTSTPSRTRAGPTGAHAAADRASTGVEGLDEILGGGLTRSRVYLLEGTPGTGKTTFALRFLIEGSRRGERGLYITLSELPRSCRRRVVRTAGR